MTSTTETIVSVIGARPHFVKAFPLMRELAGRRVRHYIIHTGQHYDEKMSQVFFDQLVLPPPDINLGVGSGSHAEQTGKIMLGVERVVLELKPQAVVVFGDTNSTLAAAIATAKHYYPLVHIEGGVRCANRRMPEEINRVLVDHISDFNICPSELAVRNLEREGCAKGALNLGDLMYDSFLGAKAMAASRSSALSELGLESGRYLLATIHRESSTGDLATLGKLLETLGSLGERVIFPMHPRTRALLRANRREATTIGGLTIVEPLGYLDLLQVLSHARKVVTDSGGLQKEAYWAGVPCITMMSDTAWTETVDVGWNTVVGVDAGKIREAVSAPFDHAKPRPEIYGSPGAARRLVEAMGWA